MHGLLRCVVRAKGQKKVIEILARFGIEITPRDFGRTWGLSQSIVEEHATYGHSHEPMVCALPCCYLRVGFYEPLRKEPKAPIDPGAITRPVCGRIEPDREAEFFGLDRERLKPDLPVRRR